MTNTPAPSGWLTVQEAAAASGLLEEEVRKRARQLHAESLYTIMGLPLERLQRLHRQGGILGLRSESPESLPIRQGSELKRLHHRRIILNAEMVAWWKRVDDHMQELRTQGYCTLEEIAAKQGVTVGEVKQAVKEIREKHH